ncbi:MAG TPA: SDR family oxidoreductase [Thermomicrobiales bacterium]|nr:SDR family oxidoreductase [Thermomicrobiales bacterium]
MDLGGKVALVTGASSGIGRGIAEALAQHGADVAINYHHDAAGAEETARLVRAAGRRALVVGGDVGDPEDVARMFTELDSAFDRFDILVSNAGIGGSGRVHQTTFAAWERVIRTNLHGPFLCAQQAAQRLIAQGQGGRIVNISSVHEEACSAGGAAYCASKAGLRNLTRSLALELGEYGVTVNDVAPGMILTPMNRRAQQDPEYLRWAEAQIPIRRAGLPRDIGNMVVFLCSEEGAYCTGSTFFVDGGWMLTWPPV